MAWWKFGKKKDSGGAGGEGAPAPGPAPAPSPPPAAPAPPAEGKKGFFGRVFGRKKKEEKAPPPEAPPAGQGPAEAPPAPPAPPAAAGPLPEGEQSELFSPAEVGGQEEQEEERQFPGSLGVSADGLWKISKTKWDAIMQGTLHGEDVKTFILAMEAGDLKTAAQMVADAYDETVGALLDIDRSVIRHIGY
ncbi:hypothetical protein [Streptomyces sp. NPDC094049]|uniref:hypothetical protein n=1 Tax=Streptomyces sp. NPDC094049 TaxID=3154987 RepID=UPI0033199E0B